MPKKKLPSMTLTFSGFIFGTVIGILGNIGPDSIKFGLQQLAQSVNLSYGYFWLILIVLFSMLGFAAAFLKERYDSGEKKAAPADISESERDNIIEILTQSYENRLAQKLDQRITLKLQLKFAKEGTSKQYSETYFVQDAKDEVEIRSTLSAVLHKHLFLLIIGEPGAGKTTLLLDLAIAFLELAKDDESQPYPVILNLASWQKDKNFGEWIIDVLVEGNGFNRKLAQEVVDKKQVLPFLDGLDEISDKDLRNDCLDKIQHFLPEYEPKKLVICSRINEYKEIVTDAPVKAEVLVKQLTELQVRKVLQTIINNPQREAKRPFANPTAAQTILKLIDKSPSFAEVLCTPFYFNLASQIFDTYIIDDEFPQSEEDWRNYLVASFIEKKLLMKSRIFSSPDKNKYYLSWLAKKLNDKDIISFELSTFQPSFLKIPIFFRIVFGLSIGLGIGLGVGVSIGLTFGLSFGLSIGLLLSLAICLIFGFSNEEIETEDVRKWRWSNIFSLKSWKNILISGFSTALYVTLISCFILGLVFNLLTGLIYGLAGGLIAGFIGGFIDEISEIIYFSKTQNPYQRLKSGFLFNILQWILIIYIPTFVFNISRGQKFLETFYYTLPILFTSAGYGLLVSPVFKHFVLRFCFYFEGSLPWRLVTFLNYVTELRILERDGGQWRFRHKILQDHFAGLDLIKN